MPTPNEKFLWKLSVCASKGVPIEALAILRDLHAPSAKLREALDLIRGLTSHVAFLESTLRSIVEHPLLNDMDRRDVLEKLDARRARAG